jgi:hypothetical protein
MEVVSTRRAQQQADDLDRKYSRAYRAFVDDLARNGCAALGYRLTGPVPVSRMTRTRIATFMWAFTSSWTLPRWRESAGVNRGEGGRPPPGLGDDLADLIIRAAKQRRPRR